MTTYQFEIEDEKWDDWKDTVPRSKSLDERIRELLEADADGRVVEDEVRTPVREDEPKSAQVEGSASEPDAAAVDAEAAVDDAVERVSTGWDDTDDRLAARRAAARAVLQHALETGDAIGKGEALEQFLPEFAVDGQTDETWWRKNIRPVLKDVGDYSNAEHGYVVDELDG